MLEFREKHYSRSLGREMEYAVFGSAGKTALAFAPQNGRFYDLKGFGMVESVRPWIESGMLRLVCVDSIDAETWSDAYGDPRRRIEQQERWFHYVVDEVFPLYVQPGGTAMALGCSMGGVHAGIFFFRRPDLFDTMISLSGLFNAGYFFHGWSDELVYANSPASFLPGMPEDHPWMALYRRSRIIMCAGQGAWEDDLLAGTRELDAILTAKGIAHWADYWGADVSHDWYWWQKQLPYYMGHVLGAPQGPGGV